MKKIDFKNEKSPVVKVEQLKDRYLFTLLCDYERFAGCPLSGLKTGKYANVIKFIDGKHVTLVVKDFVAPVIYSVVKRYCENCVAAQPVRVLEKQEKRDGFKVLERIELQKRETEKQQQKVR